MGLESVGGLLKKLIWSFARIYFAVKCCLRKMSAMRLIVITPAQRFSKLASCIFACNSFASASCMPWPVGNLPATLVD